MDTFKMIAVTLIVIIGIVAIALTIGHYSDKDAQRKQMIQLKCIEAKGDMLYDRYGHAQGCRPR